MTPPLLSVDFEPAEHTYWLNGSELPSVTTILAAAGLSGSPFWKEEHRNRGTAVHQVALLLTKRPWQGETPQEIIANSAWNPEATHPALVPYGLACASFLKETGFRPYLVEQPCASTRLQIAGTPDALGTMPSGETVLVDYKSGEPQQSAVWCQLALYSLLIEETYGVKPDKIVPVWLRPTGDYKMWPMQAPTGQHLSVGLAAVSLYHWRKRHNMLG